MVNKALERWQGILSPHLKQLLEAAKRMEWPFVPESWQYEDDSNLSKEQTIPLKDLIEAPNSHEKGMRECDVLLKCIEVAIETKDYATASAVLFLIDRFMYFFGGSRALLKFIADIETHSPETPIAPQIMIRKARVKKDEGALQETEEILNKTMNTELGKWQYKNEHQYNLVCAVCVQIKGVIKYNLGLWYDAAKYVLDSIVGFNSLPKPDKKGLSSSLGIFADILKNISPAKFAHLKQEYNLVNCVWHPLLEAHSSGKEAARLARHEKLFFSRNLRRAAINLWMYASVTAQAQQPLAFQQALNDLTTSCTKYKTIEDFKSREQAFEFVSSLFYIQLAMRSISEFQGMSLGMNDDRAADCTSYEQLGTICETLYGEICSTGGKTSDWTFTDNSNLEIKKAFHILGLTHFDKEASSVAFYDNEDATSYSYPRRVVSGVLETFENLTIAFGNEETQLKNQQKPSSVMVHDPSATTKLDDTTTGTDPSQVKSSGVQVVDPSATTAAATSDFHEAKISSTTEEFSDASGQSTTNDTSVTTDSEASSNHQKSTSRDPTEQQFLDSTVDPSEVSTENLNEQMNVSAERFGLHSLRITTEEGQSNEIKETSGELSPGVHRAIIWRYNPEEANWSTQPTLVNIGGQLNVKQKGKHRDVYHVKYLDQEEPLSRYAGKIYRQERRIEQYLQDVICQMTARYYVALFNSSLAETAGKAQREDRPIKENKTAEIQFLPVVHLQLVTPTGEIIRYMNIEPFVEGDFIKLTNNFQFKNIREDGLATAFSHFTFVKSGGKVMVVDLQGWLSSNNTGVVLLTDPQINSIESIRTQFGAANMGERGFKMFWEKVHSECNSTCKRLGIQDARGGQA